MSFYNLNQRVRLYLMDFKNSNPDFYKTKLGNIPVSELTVKQLEWFYNKVCEHDLRQFKY